MKWSNVRRVLEIQASRSGILHSETEMGGCNSPLAASVRSATLTPMPKVKPPGSTSIGTVLDFELANGSASEHESNSGEAKPQQRDQTELHPPFNIMGDWGGENLRQDGRFSSLSASIGEIPSPRWGEGGRRPDEVRRTNPLDCAGVRCRVRSLPANNARKNATRDTDRMPRQIQNLRRTRDLLLPRLLSGDCTLKS